MKVNRCGNCPYWEAGVGLLIPGTATGQVDTAGLCKLFPENLKKMSSEWCAQHPELQWAMMLIMNKRQETMARMGGKREPRTNEAPAARSASDEA